MNSVLWSLALEGMKSREVGDVEAADTCEGVWLTRTDENTHHKYVNTAYAKRRRLKTANR